MDLLLSVFPRKEASVIRSILNNKKAFPKIKNLQAYSDEKGSFVIVTLDMGILNVIEASKLQSRYEKIKHVLSATATQTIEDDFKSNIKDKNCHFFFDIDSTITKGGLGTIHRTIRPIFENMKQDGYRIYFVSGRSEAQVKEDMTAFDTEPYGIAENGGIIIGIGDNGHLIFGDRTEPDKALRYLKNNYNKITEDIKHGYRVTERIIRNTIPEAKLQACIRKSGAVVGVLASKTSYHIAKKNVHKGSSIDKLTSDLRFGSDDIVIAVGDSDLDIPMFLEAPLSFAVGNASKRAAAAAKVNLQHDYADGVKEMYENWFNI